MNILKNTKGSLAVETAIVLPLFLIGILTLGYLIKFTMANEGVFHALADETGKFTAESASPLRIAAYEQDVITRAERESLGDVRAAQVSGRYRIPYAGKTGSLYTNLVGVSVTWDTPLRLPRLTRDSLGGQATILSRAFVGGSNDSAILPFSEMETDDSGGTVWVFPRAGERYHTEHCSVIENNPQERLLDRTVKWQFQSCQLCGAASAREGSLVYCFPASGRVFHTGDCFLVERYVMEIGREDAKKQGFTACMICGGGG
jgi:hypothetical protein